ncbi:uncharacterized protein LOC132302810 isoform X2 [Cornus florida]|uniref:uncharacterized protein LOC132302810 isoform X2 n=1 Tax=Cornus florida TaxID=4283 RepID=UPI0028972FDC|nr:uncharacterized protein LOC132302810 isoform X2 [Cornus florida]
MGTKVHCKSYLPAYYSMRNHDDNSNSSSWHLFHGDKTLANGQFYNSFFPWSVADAYPSHDKVALKQKMLEHEAIFKNQVYELHRLYKIQRDMMDEIKKREAHKQWISIDTSSSSTPLPSQMPSEEVQKWHITSFPLASSVSARQSVSGAEIINSPVSCTKGDGMQTGPSPSQNGCSSKDCEVLESRPSKVRKKLFNLQLPADEYIDTEEGEQSLDNKTSYILSYSPNTNHNVAHESGVKLFLGAEVKNDCQVDASRSGSCLRRSIGLADLNEPLQLEEASVPASVDFLGRAASHGEINGLDLSSKPKSQLILNNSQHGNNNGTLSNISIENKGNGREWFSHMYEEGLSKGYLNPIHQGTLSSHYSRGDLRRDGTVHRLEISERSCDVSNFSHLDPAVASPIPGPYQFVNSCDLANARSSSVSSCRNPSSSFTQKLTSIQKLPSFNSSVTLSRSSQSSAQSHEIFGNKWLLNSSSMSNHGLGCDLPNRNGFYHGSSSGSKEVPACIPSVGFDYLKFCKNDNMGSERSINYGSGSFFKGSNVIDLNSRKGMNLNVSLSKSSSNMVASQDALEIIDGEGKHEDHLGAALPWLRAKPASKSETINMRRDSNSVEMSFFQTSSNQLSIKTEKDKGPNQIFTQNLTSASCDHNVGANRDEIGDSLGNRKILGFPISVNPCTSRNESSSHGSTSASLRSRLHGNGEIDINVAFDLLIPETSKQSSAEILVEDKEMGTKVSIFRNHIDLNLSASVDEVFLAPSVANTSANVKLALEIDLEAPVVPEIEEDFLHGEEQKQPETPLRSPQHKAENPEHEIVRIAAEAIVSISSSAHQNHTEDTACHPSEASLADSLLWFVDVVSSCADDLENILGSESRGKNGGENEQSSSNEIDDFEAMTLKLTEIKEEEYMPMPLVPETREVEGTGVTSVTSRSQKGQARRGRQRRDFQRDILPGLASLSRHEVTEDLQTFGGLMRATGHPWHSGSTRRSCTRNGGGRGRRRSLVDSTPAVAAGTICTPLMQQLNNIEVGLEDRSLTGWGKTTRRPRRQRCPPGNPSSVHLT